ncbi:LacI family DNA-binding transcriptional regulator [Pontibacillus salipaludis]|uniref:Catabolite control protein A n=1 Tax=Pontibacillus salipaludis TaxID=1697394 RepID=A0ABQ1Q0S2_9BACI|nr:LacI family DNA-binding transcriptional regulator [Pontibacillus salipaludis]GGD08553.1 catabolite control protein A [Pontibacillus salipaludis]
MREDINITEVARKAGVSIATVSRVFNNNGPVKESTRKKIEQVIKETGYRPNILARELAEKKTHLIGVITHSILGEGLPNSIKGITHVIEEKGYNLLIGNTDGQIEKEQKHFEIFQSKRVEGVLFMTRHFTQEHRDVIEALPFPVVVLLQPTEDEKISYVAFDEYRFAQEATRYLLDKGHEDFVFIGGPETSANSLRREQGFKNALTSAGYSLDKERIIHEDYSIEAGYEATKRLVKEGVPFTAMIIANDGMAIGAINALQDSGYSIPRDVSIIGLDDTALAKASRPSLTAIHYSYQDLGKEGANLLLDKIESGNVDFSYKVLPYELKKRGSTEERY